MLRRHFNCRYSWCIHAGRYDTCETEKKIAELLAKIHPKQLKTLFTWRMENSYVREAVQGPVWQTQDSATFLANTFRKIAEVGV